MMSRIARARRFETATPVDTHDEAFPHGPNQFISATATSWAAIALAATLDQ